MKAKLILATVTLFALSTGAAQAQIRKTAKNQSARIAQGIKSGELTKKEACTLIRQQKEIRKDVKEAKADGVVTLSERKEIRQDQNQASKSIYRKKHNNRDRY
jgi:hypothetical protein